MDPTLSHRFTICFKSEGSPTPSSRFINLIAFNQGLVRIPSRLINLIVFNQGLVRIPTALLPGGRARQWDAAENTPLGASLQGLCPLTLTQGSTLRKKSAHIGNSRTERYRYGLGNGRSHLLLRGTALSFWEEYKGNHAPLARLDFRALPQPPWGAQLCLGQKACYSGSADERSSVLVTQQELCSCRWTEIAHPLTLLTKALLRLV